MAGQSTYVMRTSWYSRKMFLLIGLWSWTLATVMVVWGGHRLLASAFGLVVCGMYVLPVAGVLFTKQVVLKRTTIEKNIGMGAIVLFRKSFDVSSSTRLDVSRITGGESADTYGLYVSDTGTRRVFLCQFAYEENAKRVAEFANELISSEENA